MTLKHLAGIGTRLPPWQGPLAGAPGEPAAPADGLLAGRHHYGLLSVAWVAWVEEDGPSLGAWVDLWVLHLAGRVDVADDERSLSPYEGLV
jgi:hypothetical protein